MDKEEEEMKKSPKSRLICLKKKGTHALMQTMATKIINLNYQYFLTIFNHLY